MFKGEIEFKEGYHATNDLDTIMSLIHRFKNEYKYGIESIEKEDTEEKILKINMSDLVIEVNERHGVSGYSAITIICHEDIKKFNKIYNYLNYYLTDNDFKVGDIVYYNRIQCKVKSVIDDRIIEVETDDGVVSQEYKSWGLRFN